MKNRFKPSLLPFTAVFALSAVLGLGGVLTARAQATPVVFDTPGTYQFNIPKDGATSIKVKVWGAGGYGGATYLSGIGAQGGGGGGYVEKTFSPSELSGISSPITISVGKSRTLNTGAVLATENSSFGSILTAYGGQTGSGTTGLFGGSGGSGVSTLSGATILQGESGTPSAADYKDLVYISQSPGVVAKYGTANQKRVFVEYANILRGDGGPGGAGAGNGGAGGAGGFFCINSTTTGPDPGFCRDHWGSPGSEPGGGGGGGGVFRSDNLGGSASVKGGDGRVIVETIVGTPVNIPNPSFDYSLSNSGNVSVAPGQSVGNTITATIAAAASSFNNQVPVTLSPRIINSSGVDVTGSMVTGSFGTNPVRPTAQSLLTLGTTLSTPPGNYNVIVTGTTQTGQTGQTGTTGASSAITCESIGGNPNPGSDQRGFECSTPGGTIGCYWDMISQSLSNREQSMLQCGGSSGPVRAPTYSQFFDKIAAPYMNQLCGANNWTKTGGGAVCTAALANNATAIALPPKTTTFILTVTPPMSLPPTVSCEVLPLSATTGQPVTWTATASGGDGTYTYSFAGDDSFSNISGSVTGPITGTTYSAPAMSYLSLGTKRANVTVTSGGMTTGAVDCRTSVNIYGEKPTLNFPVVGTCAKGDPTTVYLSWTPPNNNQVLGYKIFRKDQQGNVQQVGATTGKAGVKFPDNTGVQGTTFNYYVQAVYIGGDSAPSNVVTATTATCAPVIIGKPDLTSTISINNPTPHPGDALILSGTVSNTGIAQTGTFSNEYQVSVNGGPYALFANAGALADIAGTPKATRPHPWTAGAAGPTTYSFQLCADTPTLGVVAEANSLGTGEANNCSTALTIVITPPSQNPDLTSTISISGTIIPGTTFYEAGKPLNMSGVIRNSGGQNIASPFKSQFQFSVDPAQTENSFVFFDNEVPLSGLPAGGQSMVSFQHPTNGNDLQTYYFRLCADRSVSNPAGDIAEVNSQGTGETNNCSVTTSITFRNPTVTPGTLSCTVDSPTETTLNWTQTGGTNVSIFRGSKFLQTVTGTSGSFKDTLLQPGTLYTYYLRDGATSAAKEITRDVCATPLAAKKPDLTSAISVSNSRPLPGERITLSGTVSNKNTPYSGIFSNAYYISDNGSPYVPYANAAAINSIDASGPNATKNVRPYSWNVGAADGHTYNFELCADAPPAIALVDEENENNNCSAAVTVVIGSPASVTPTISPPVQAPTDPDLTATISVSNSTPKPNERITLSGAISNIGAPHIGNFSNEYRMSVNGGPYAFYANAAGLTDIAGTPKAVRPWSWNVGAAGPTVYSFILCADTPGNGVVIEKNSSGTAENNNCSAPVSVTVVPAGTIGNTGCPGPACPSPSGGVGGATCSWITPASFDVDAGTSFQLNWRSTNVGTTGSCYLTDTTSGQSVPVSAQGPIDIPGMQSSNSYSLSCRPSSIGTSVQCSAGAKVNANVKVFRVITLDVTDPRYGNVHATSPTKPGEAQQLIPPARVRKGKPFNLSGTVAGQFDRYEITSIDSNQNTGSYNNSMVTTVVNGGNIDIIQDVSLVTYTFKGTYIDSSGEFASVHASIKVQAIDPDVGEF